MRHATRARQSQKDTGNPEVRQPKLNIWAPDLAISIMSVNTVVLNKEILEYICLTLWCNLNNEIRLNFFVFLDMFSSLYFIVYQWFSLFKTIVFAGIKISRNQTLKCLAWVACQTGLTSFVSGFFYPHKKYLRPTGFPNFPGFEKVHKKRWVSWTTCVNDLRGFSQVVKISFLIRMHSSLKYQNSMYRVLAGNHFSASPTGITGARS